MNYNKLLLDELRLITFEKGDTVLNDYLIAKAVTLNENLQSLGFALSPKDMLSVAASPSLDGLYDKVRDMTDAVKAEPMYPGFPQQVMEMDEAVFRFHQAVHYFSTYGMESLFGVDVKRGWLPCEPDEKKEPLEQKRILEAKTVKLLPVEEAYTAPLHIILSKKERMTLPEKEIVAEAIKHVSVDQAAALRVPFKENMNVLYGVIFGMTDRDASFGILRNLCHHTGDVMRCVDILLGQNRFHFRTSQKRFLVNLLESYPVKDFRANLIISGKGAERNILLLNYLDYSIYSKSVEHMAAVHDLRDGKLRSWESMAKALLRSGDKGALDFIAQRPGMMLRMCAWLMRSGYSPEDLINKLVDNAPVLSMQTLVTNLTFFGKLTTDERPDCRDLYYVFEKLLAAHMQKTETPLRGKKVVLKMDEFDLKNSEIHCSDKSAEGGYVRSGIAYRIPDGIDALRFFVYWNDRERVDVDLHAGFTDLKGENHHVGWNREFRDSGVVFSGDITHSNAAEYIDIDLTAPIDKVYANIHLYCGKPDFSLIESCFVGMMAVPKNPVSDCDVNLYSSANCFFTHNLRQKCSTVNYGYIDVQNRCLVFDGEPGNWNNDWYSGKKHRRSELTLARYLEMLIESQGAVICQNDEDADVVLVMGKAEKKKELSLVDANFFMD